MPTAFITGANRGIGLGLAKTFLQAKFDVIATARNLENAFELKNLQGDFADQLKILPLDVTSETSVSSLKIALEAMFGKTNLRNIEILINNSGVFLDSAQTLAELPLTDFSRTFDVNTFGPIRVTQALLPFLSKSAKICHITSKMGSLADNQSGGYYAYRSSKAALNMFNKCLSYELKASTCLVLHPGWVQTDMGGKKATTTIDQSVAGLFKVITQSQQKDSGKFFDFNGVELPW